MFLTNLGRLVVRLKTKVEISDSGKKHTRALRRYLLKSFMIRWYERC
jgi:hypothetical protein